MDLETWPSEEFLSLVHFRLLMVAQVGFTGWTRRPWGVSTLEQ
jgi:hypothetical protein